MPRVIISKRVLDRLIRAKLTQLDICREVAAMPVVFHAPCGKSCNWMIPGWTGEVAKVTECTKKISGYIDFLRTQFDVADR